MTVFQFLTGVGRGFFLFAIVFRLALVPTYPHIQWVLGSSFPRVKRLGREADHSSPYSTEDKNAWSYNSTPPYVFVAWY